MIEMNEGHNLRINREKLRLREDCQREEYVRQSIPNSARGKSSHF